MLRIFFLFGLNIICWESKREILNFLNSKGILNWKKYFVCELSVKGRKLNCMFISIALMRNNFFWALKNKRKTGQCNLTDVWK